MDETLIVIMLKDKQTGFLDKELGGYNVGDDDIFIYNAYAEEENGEYIVRMKLTCNKDVEDWEFNAIYDYYDSSVFY